MRISKLIQFTAICCFAIPAMAIAEEHWVGQKDKAFSADELTVKVGDSVHFKNEDPFFHNVYSLSDLKMFDLGSFPEGEHETVVFEESGELEVECAIHPDMMMLITVEE